MRILFTDTGRYRLNNAHRSVMGMEGGGGGGGGGGQVSPYRPAACAFISSSRFRPSLTGLVEPGRSAEPRLRSHGVCKSI